VSGGAEKVKKKNISVEKNVYYEDTVLHTYVYIFIFNIYLYIYIYYTCIVYH